MGDISEHIRPERSDAAANRARILDAARQVFAVRGVEGEMKDIATRAGVGVGTLYRHFESREGLLATLIQETRDELLRRFELAVRTETPAAAFRAIIIAAGDVYDRFGALIELAIADRLRELGGSSYEEFTRLMESLLRRGIDEGSFRHDLDVPTVIAALESVFQSGKLVELAAARGYAAASEAIAAFFLAACLTPTRP